MALTGMQGFKILRVKVDSNSNVERQLFVKAHSAREVDAYRPKERTLFVLNIPPYIDKECLEKFFSDYGAIESVYLHSKPTSETPVLKDSRYFPKAENPKGYKLAYVVFKNESGVKNVLKFPSTKVRVLTNENTGASISVGIEKYCQEYINIAVNSEELLPKLEKYFEDYDENQKEEELKSKLAAEMTDTEGWTTVSRHSKVKAIPIKKKNKRRFRRREKKNKEIKELLDFYTFQHKESQQNRIAVLRQKFEEDKQKIALMKATRKFKPF